MAMTRASTISPELPPRARRIRVILPVPSGTTGTTSACAENTVTERTFLMIFWNYLRVRGEYDLVEGARRLAWELPPRARRILIGERQVRRYLGTTSACAENTLPALFFADDPRNYLRVRGEYLSHDSLREIHMELPPRARRIHTIGLNRHMPTGTTSACAENT